MEFILYSNVKNDHKQTIFDQVSQTLRPNRNIAAITSSKTSVFISGK